MADEEKTSQEQDHAPEESASEAAPEAAEAEAPDEDAPEAEAPEEPEAPEAEAEAPEEDAPDAEAAAGESDAPAAEPSDQEPERPLTPKERRKLERSRHRGEPGPQRSPSDRAAQRAERRQDRAAERRRYRPRSRVRRAGAGEGTPPAERRPGAQKVRQGMVVSARADKTITVKVEIARRHRMYEKVVRRSATLLAHDEANRASEGDLVRVVETRPLSKTKRWRLVEILEKAR